MNILVIGGAGYIGSHMCRRLKSAGHKVTVYDNLSSGHKYAVKDFTLVEGCLGDKKKLKHTFQTYKIEAIMHFAAHIEVAESVINPSKYYENNFCRVVSLLDQIIESDIKNFVFSSTAAVYGNHMMNISLKEDTPCIPINPYGKSKLMVENLLSDYNKAYGLNYTVFRYFKASGADDNTDIGENHKPETHLIPLVLKTAKGEREAIKIFGTDYNTPDGTCIRDYIHVNDIADAHILGLSRMVTEKVSETFNLGNGNGFSVREIIDTAERITGVKIKQLETCRREGDCDILIANCNKAMKILEWKPNYNLSKIISSAWEWEKKLKND